MSDLISRQLVIKTLCERRCGDTPKGCPAGFCTVSLMVDCIPSAQPEIIHCESCEHWKNEHLCECLSRYGTFETPKNFYCGYGKEK